MAHIATRRFSYWGQLGILLGLIGVGTLIGQGIGLVMLLSKDATILSNPTLAMDKILVPANANLLRVLQLVEVVFMFILPAFIYAKICHKKPAIHLGLQKSVQPSVLILAVLLIFSALPLVGAFRELTMHLPLGSYIKNKITQSQADYTKQVMVIGIMRSFGEYLISLFIIAIIAGFSEELIFRGALQNLFTRWFKKPVPSILLTAFLFSAFHFEYSDFLGRFFLGIVLGWVFYKTGNLWINIIMHASFNAISVTGLYLVSLSKGKIDAKDMEDKFSLSLTLIALAIFATLCYYFYKVNKKNTTKVAGQEILLPGYINSNNPFLSDVTEIDN